MKLRVLPQVESDVVAAVQWYDQRSAVHGDKFLSAYCDVLASIQMSPKSNAGIETAPRTKNIRRCRLKQFPYYIVFRHDEDQLLIVAVVHASRRPNSWRKRLSE